MANKQVKDLKKGDLIKSSISDGQRIYLGMCSIVELENFPVYDSTGVRGNGQTILRKMSYIAKTGKLKGMRFNAWVPETEFCFVPDRPNRFFRAIAELFSS